MCASKFGRTPRAVGLVLALSCGVSGCKADDAGSQAPVAVPATRGAPQPEFVFPHLQQAAQNSSEAGAGGSLAVLPIALDFDAANAVGDVDRRLGDRANEQLRAALKDGPYTLADQDRVAGAVEADEECADSRCAAEVGSAVGADRVLMTKLTKVSSLIWFVNSRLLDTRTGRVLQVEDLELKGNAADMIPGGMAALARRVNKQ